MIRRPPRSTLDRSSAASDVYKRQAAIVPRVIVTDPVLKAAKLDAQAKEDPILPDEHDLLCRDIDGWWFINYLQSAVGPTGVNWRQIEEHKQAVLTSLSRSARHDIL